MRIKVGENSLGIIFSKDKALYFSEDMPFMCVGQGKAEYKMSRGSFKIKDKPLMNKKLYINSCKPTDEGAEILLYDENGSPTMEIQLKLEKGRVSFTPTIISGESFNRMSFRIPATADETVYGGGETFSEFNLRGKKQRVWVAEHINAKQITRKVLQTTFNIKAPEKKQKYSNYETYYAQPTFLSSQKYFMHCDTTAYAMFDFTKEKYHEISIREVCPIYFGFSDTYAGLMENLSSLLGRQPMLPDWVYDGAILGIQGGTQTVYDKLESAKRHNTALAGVWCQDWEGRRVTAFGKQLQWNWEWDEERYPELDKKIWELKEEGIKFLGYTNPFLAIEKPLYKYAAEKGYCVKDKNGKDYYVEITTFPAAMVDLTNPEAYEWLKNVIKENMIAFGLDGWMADFGEYLPTDCVLYSGENPEIVHNSWPARWAKLNREALEETNNVGKIFFFTRAGYTETVKYSTMMWTGDQHVDWSVDFGLPSVIPASLSLAVCGFGLTHSDVGGYTTFGKLRRSPELLMRWSEMNAFSPLMRSHEGSNPDLNVHFDSSEEILSHHGKYSRIHRALKPYLKSADEENSKVGMPVMRPLFFHYEGETEHKEYTQYLLGRDLLVAPIIKEGAVSRSVYLPEDVWIDIWSGKEYSGGKYNIEAPLGRIPVFFRKQSPYAGLFESLKNE